MQTFYIKTFGCQSNIADSNTMAGMLEALGLEEFTFEGQSFNNDLEEMTFILQNCDLIILNTCSIRQKSEDKVFGIGKVLKRLRDENKKLPYIVLSGCMVGSVTGERQRYAFEELRKKTPWVNLYLNPSQISNLPTKLLEENVLESWVQSKTNFDPEKEREISKNEDLTISKTSHAFVNISYGCDNFCTFCVVPYARGAEISRKKEDILREVNMLVKRGATKITLCGQNVNSWGLTTREKFDARAGGDQKLPFAQLLRDLCEIEEISQIDFLSSNPFDFTTDLLNAIKHPKISNYMHIAVQSGNNEVLKRMNRRHTIEDFYSLVEKIKEAKPTFELGTDIIVGFPGETEEQFEDTIKLFQKVKFNVAFISIYSPRKGTPSEKFFKDDVSFNEKKRRHAALTKVWRDSKK